MYHIYRTPGFILKANHVGEADGYFTIYTRDMGLVKAYAKGVRNLKSKLRPCLGDYSYSEFMLVKGKHAWKITNAIGLGNLFYELAANKKIMNVFANVFALLRNLLHGQEKNEMLFHHILSSYMFSKENRIRDDQVPQFECMLVLRILHSLGYVGASSHLYRLIDSKEWREDRLEELKHLMPHAVLEINRSLSASQL